MADSDHQPDRAYAVRRATMGRCQSRGVAGALLLALVAAHAGCDQADDASPIARPDPRDQFELIVHRLESVIDDAPSAAAVPNGTLPSRRYVSSSSMTPAADGKPASGTIIVCTVPARLAPRPTGNAVAAGEQAAGLDASAPDSATAPEDDAVEEATFRLIHGDSGWRLAEEPQQEVERLWFEYALVD